MRILLMKKPLDFIKQYWLLSVVIVGIVLFIYLLLFRSLGTLPGGFSAGETASQADAVSLRSIVQQPVNAPYKLLIWGASIIGYHDLLATRLVAATFAIGTAMLFYWIVLHWYSKRIAIISSILFVCSSGYLHTARYGTALILQTSTLALISAVLLYKRAKKERAVTYLITLLLAFLAYVPGMLWFQALGLIVVRKGVIKLFQRLGPKHTAAIITLYVILVTPIIWAAIHNIQSLLFILGLPEHIPTASVLLHNSLNLVKSIIYHGYYSPEYWLYGAPLLNIAEIIFFIAGLFQLFKQPMVTANYWLGAALVISTLLFILGGSVTIAILVPLIYLVISGGFYYLLHQWLAVFPRNPIARNTGVTLLCLVVAFSVYYHLRAYYIAWPQAPETKHAYISRQ